MIISIQKTKDIFNNQKNLAQSLKRLSLGPPRLHNGSGNLIFSPSSLKNLIEVTNLCENIQYLEIYGLSESQFLWLKESIQTSKPESSFKYNFDTQSKQALVTSKEYNIIEHAILFHSDIQIAPFNDATYFSNVPNHTVTWEFNQSDDQSVNTEDNFENEESLALQNYNQYYSYFADCELVNDFQELEILSNLYKPKFQKATDEEDGYNQYIANQTQANSRILENILYRNEHMDLMEYEEPFGQQGEDLDNATELLYDTNFRFPQFTSSQNDLQQLQMDNNQEQQSQDNLGLSQDMTNLTLNDDQQFDGYTSEGANLQRFRINGQQNLQHAQRRQNREDIANSNNYQNGTQEIRDDDLNQIYNHQFKSKFRRGNIFRRQGGNYQIQTNARTRLRSFGLRNQEQLRYTQYNQNRFQQQRSNYNHNYRYNELRNYYNSHIAATECQRRQQRRNQRSKLNQNKPQKQKQRRKNKSRNKNQTRNKDILGLRDNYIDTGALPYADYMSNNQNPQKQKQRQQNFKEQFNYRQRPYNYTYEDGESGDDFSLDSVQQLFQNQDSDESLSQNKQDQQGQYSPQEQQLQEDFDGINQGFRQQYGGIYEFTDGKNDNYQTRQDLKNFEKDDFLVSDDDALVYSTNAEEEDFNADFHYVQGLQKRRDHERTASQQEAWENRKRKLKEHRKKRKQKLLKQRKTSLQRRQQNEQENSTDSSSQITSQIQLENERQGVNISAQNQKQKYNKQKKKAQVEEDDFFRQDDDSILYETSANTSEILRDQENEWIRGRHKRRDHEPQHNDQQNLDNSLMQAQSQLRQNNGIRNLRQDSYIQDDGLNDFEVNQDWNNNLEHDLELDHPDSIQNGQKISIENAKINQQGNHSQEELLATNFDQDNNNQTQATQARNFDIGSDHQYLQSYEIMRFQHTQGQLRKALQPSNIINELSNQAYSKANKINENSANELRNEGTVGNRQRASPKMNQQVHNYVKKATRSQQSTSQDDFFRHDEDSILYDTSANSSEIERDQYNEWVYGRRKRRDHEPSKKQKSKQKRRQKQRRKHVIFPDSNSQPPEAYSKIQEIRSNIYEPQAQKNQVILPNIESLSTDQIITTQEKRSTGSPSNGQIYIQNSQKDYLSQDGKSDDLNQRNLQQYQKVNNNDILINKLNYFENSQEIQMDKQQGYINSSNTSNQQSEKYNASGSLNIDQFLIQGKDVEVISKNTVVNRQNNIIRKNDQNNTSLQDRQGIPYNTQKDENLQNQSASLHQIIQKFRPSNQNSVWDQQQDLPRHQTLQNNNSQQLQNHNQNEKTNDSMRNNCTSSDEEDLPFQQQIQQQEQIRQQEVQKKQKLWEEFQELQAGLSKKQRREVQNLLPFAWDKRLQDNPAGKEFQQTLQQLKQMYSKEKLRDIEQKFMSSQQNS